MQRFYTENIEEHTITNKQSTKEHLVVHNKKEKK